MTQEDFTALIADTVERRDIQVRQVSNGFTLAGVRHFLDNETLTEKFSIGIEGVAADGASALQCIENFYAQPGGTF